METLNVFWVDLGPDLKGFASAPGFDKDVTRDALVMNYQAAPDGLFTPDGFGTGLILVHEVCVCVCV